MRTAFFFYQKLKNFGKPFFHFVYRVLPFKFLFIMTIFFRCLTKKNKLDPYFYIYQRSRFKKHEKWIFEGIIPTYFHHHTVHLLDKSHFLAWLYEKKPDLEKYKFLLFDMLDHAIHSELPKKGQIRKNTDNKNLDIGEYCVCFFHDKQIVLSLIEEMQLIHIKKDFDYFNKKNNYIEYSSKYILNPDLYKDVKLFYAYKHLALKTYHDGNGHMIPLIGNNLYKVQKRLKHFTPSPSKKLDKLLQSFNIDFPTLKILSPDWSALIGHNGHLNVHLMMGKMGWWQGCPLILGYRKKIANPPFLSLFSKLCPVLILNENIGIDLWLEIVNLMPFFGVSHQIFTYKDETSVYWNDAGAKAMQEWDSLNFGYPLRKIYDDSSLSNEGEVQLAGLRKKWGMLPEDWYVCLHMRDTATRGEEQGKGESIRSTSFKNYIDTIRFITDQGGFVIRMGSREAPKLPQMKNLIDYATNGDSTPLMDIHLVRHARLFIGTTSGFAYVATSFNIPTAIVNAISSMGLLLTKDTRFIPKHIKTYQGRMLTQQEIISEKWRWSYPTYESLKRAGLTVQDNSSDEILETVKEVFQLSINNSNKLSSSVEKWKRSLTVPSFYGKARPSEFFLEKFPEFNS